MKIFHFSNNWSWVFPEVQLFLEDTLLTGPQNTTLFKNVAQSYRIASLEVKPLNHFNYPSIIRIYWSNNRSDQLTLSARFCLSPSFWQRRCKHASKILNHRTSPALFSLSANHIPWSCPYLSSPSFQPIRFRIPPFHRFNAKYISVSGPNLQKTLIISCFFPLLTLYLVFMGH